MRTRIVLGLAAAALCLAPVARASTLPDLPGMGPAQKATGGTTPALGEAKVTQNTPTTSDHRPLAQTTTGSKPASKPTLSLPGAGALPAVGSGTFASEHSSPANAGLVVAAALGSLAALAWFYYLRRAGVL
jgi:hypothetical protein